MKSVPTFTATIYMGLRAGYGDTVYPSRAAYNWLAKYCSFGGICVTFTPTTFIYKGGEDPGIIIGLINYPRFPEEIRELKEKAKEIAYKLGGELRQNRVSIVFPDETVMVEIEDEEDE